MLIVYDLDTSPNCLKTKILLYELGIPFEQRSVDHATVRGEAFRTKFPTGLAPAIEDDGLCISESAAIALHLAGKHGKLVPSDSARRGLMFQSLSIEAAILAPTVGGQGLFGELYKPESERNERRIVALRERSQWVAQVLGSALGAREWFADEVTIADIQLYAATSKSLDAKVFVDPPANLVAWCTRMSNRPSVVRARQEYVHYRSAA